MKRFYSPGRNAFFDLELHGDQIPDDAIEISDACYEGLMLAQSKGAFIIPGDGGYPVAGEGPAASPAERLAALHASALNALGRSDVTVLRSYESGVPVPPVVIAYRQALRDLINSNDPDGSLPPVPTI